VSLPQNMQALAKANETRLARAELKRELKAGTCSIDVVLLDPPDFAKAMPVLDLLGALRHFGEQKALRAFQGALPFASPHLRLGHLSRQSRQRLVDYLHANHRWAIGSKVA
jgi:hypothetical protein